MKSDTSVTDEDEDEDDDDDDETRSVLLLQQLPHSFL